MGEVSEIDGYAVPNRGEVSRESPLLNIEAFNPGVKIRRTNGDAAVGGPGEMCVRPWEPNRDRLTASHRVGAKDERRRGKLVISWS
jgi:hypothetical protein